MSKVIYALKDPITNKYRYVGQSENVAKRLAQHLYKSHNNLVNEWIKSLAELGKLPFLESLEVVGDDHMATVRENYWIDYLKDDHPLLNKVSPKLSDFGSVVKYLKERTDLTQYELAEKAGVGLRFVRDLEQGKLTCRVDKVNDVLRLFGYHLMPVKIKDGIEFHTNR